MFKEFIHNRRVFSPSVSVILNVFVYFILQCFKLLLRSFYVFVTKYVFAMQYSIIIFIYCIKGFFIYQRFIIISDYIGDKGMSIYISIIIYNFFCSDKFGRRYVYNIIKHMLIPKCGCFISDICFKGIDCIICRLCICK